MLAGMVSTSLYPSRRQTSARPMPVLPLVGSTTQSPGFSFPLAAASSIMAREMRSLIEPAGLRCSHFAQRVAAPSGARLLMRTIGVLPTNSSMESTTGARFIVDSDRIDVPARRAAPHTLFFPAGAEILKCDGVEAGRDFLGKLLENALRDGTARCVLIDRVFFSLSNDDIAFERADHIAKRDLIRRLREGVTAARPTLRVDDARA